MVGQTIKYITIFLTWWRNFSYFERCLLVIALIVVILCILFIIGIGVIVSILKPCDTKTGSFQGNMVGDSSITRNVCLKPVCVQAASFILGNMNTSVKPCDDFYKFACGNFLKETTIPDDKRLFNIFDKTRDDIQKQVRKIVEAPFVPDEPKFMRLIKIFYKSCMDKKTIETQGHEPLLMLLKKFGGWPVLEGARWNSSDFHWTKLMYKFRNEGLPTNYVIDLIIAGDLKNNSRRILHLDQPSFGIPREILVTGVSPHILTGYQQFMIDIAVLLGATKESVEIELMYAHEFEKMLATASVTSDYRRVGTRLYHLMTLGDLSENYPSVPWKEYVNSLTVPESIVADDEVINVNVPEYISKFEKIIKQVPERTQANYVMWRVIMDSIKYLTDDLRKREFKLISDAIGVSAREARWKECIRSVSDNLYIAVGSSYVRKYVKKETKKKVTEIFENVKSEMKIRLQKVRWMDNDTETNALRKISALSAHIAYPDELFDDRKIENFFRRLELSDGNYWKSSLNITRFSVDDSFFRLKKSFNKSDWRTYANVVRVGAFCSHRENSIDVAAGMLQGRYFNDKQPQYMNYGGVGITLGHEITHGFDSTGRNYGEDGSIGNWWSESSHEAFEHQTQCIIHQYSNYTVREAEMNLDGENTRNENIADNGGIKLSYLAYKKWVSQHIEPTLPGLNYTPSQLFWINAANIQCTKYRLNHLKWEIKYEVQSPAEFRVNGPFSNIREFSRDFGCPLGTKMNPRTKCTVW